jgi:alkyl hydroperoxide reductase subunit AhpC
LFQRLKLKSDEALSNIAFSFNFRRYNLAWVQSPRTKGGLGHMQIPILADTTKVISSHYGVLMKNLGRVVQIDPRMTPG